MVGDFECNTELCLSPGGRRQCPASSHSDGSAGSRRMEGCARRIPQLQQQQISLFYGGRLCVCDVTEIQARAIICMAKRQMEEMAANQQRPHEDNQEYSSLPPPPLPPSPSTPQLLNPGLSMKRSLQLFLQRRKSRTQDSSPYKPSPPSPLIS